LGIRELHGRHAVHRGWAVHRGDSHAPIPAHEGRDPRARDGLLGCPVPQGRRGGRAAVGRSVGRVGQAGRDDGQPAEDGVARGRRLMDPRQLPLRGRLPVHCH